MLLVLLDAKMTTVDSGHSAPITDIACDATGRLVATASEDKTVRVSLIFPVDQSSATQNATAQPKPPELLTCLIEHQAPVLRVAWGDYRMSGSPLLSCDVDGNIILWKDVDETKKSWTSVYTTRLQGPAVSLSWAPYDIGVMMFAAASSTGQVVVHLSNPDSKEWTKMPLEAHPSGCNAVSFCPSLPPSALMALPTKPDGRGELNFPFPRLVTCGNERSLRIWKYAPQDRQWLQERELNDLSGQNGSLSGSHPAAAHMAAPHSGVGDAAPMLDVAWAPNCGLPFTYIAAGGEDGTVIIYYQDGLEGKWQSTLLPTFSSAVCRLSWSLIGTFLSVACSDGTVTVWKEQSNGQWTSEAAVPTPQ